jgi:hypothetical protein
MIERWENIVALYQCCRNMELNDLIWFDLSKTRCKIDNF